MPLCKPMLLYHLPVKYSIKIMTKLRYLQTRQCFLESLSVRQPAEQHVSYFWSIHQCAICTQLEINKELSNWYDVQNIPRILPQRLCFLVVCCALVPLSFTHIFHGCFTGSGAIIWLPQCQQPWRIWVNESHKLTRTHNIITTKAQQNLAHILWGVLSIVYGMYCSMWPTSDPFLNVVFVQ